MVAFRHVNVNKGGQAFVRWSFRKRTSGRDGAAPQFDCGGNR
jgi:hypothetical protein